MLENDEPPGYRQVKQRPKPKLDAFLPLSHPPGEATVRIAGNVDSIATLNRCLVESCRQNLDE